MHRRLAALLVAVVVGTLASPAVAAPGTFQLDRAVYQAGSPVRATYGTNAPDDQNWVGVYSDPGNGPVNGSYVGPSTAWEYAPASGGTVAVATESLKPGNYVAYYLHDDGYTSLAPPVKFRVVKAVPQFLADPVPVRNAQAGVAYSATVKAGAWDPDGSALTYRKAGGPSWLTIGADGALSGRPAASDAGTNQFDVDVTDADGQTTRGRMRIVVRAAGTPITANLTVASFNVWLNGSKVNQSGAKQLRFVYSSGADVIGLQETLGYNARWLANQLGWHYLQTTDSSVISKYPIVDTFNPLNAPASGVRVRLGTKDAIVWTSHLYYDPYGPYDACFDKMTVAQLIERESSSGRVGEMQRILAAMKPHLDEAKSTGTPTFLTGDFNAPSHLDWVPAAASRHCGYQSVPWPVTKAVQDAGLVDSYRAVNPNPATQPGDTWSPVYPSHSGRTGAVEPQDRIDFVFSAGSARAVASSAVAAGTPLPAPNAASNDWPSDHKAVVSTFTLS